MSVLLASACLCSVFRLVVIMDHMLIGSNLQLRSDNFGVCTSFAALWCPCIIQVQPGIPRLFFGRRCL